MSMVWVMTMLVVNKPERHRFHQEGAIDSFTFSAGNFAEISSIRGALGFACFLQKLPNGFPFSRFLLYPTVNEKAVPSKKTGHERLTHGPIERC